MLLAVIDTGFTHGNASYCYFKTIRGIAIAKSENKYEYTSNYYDEIGHGTIICNILHDYLEKEIDLFVIKIFNDQIHSECDLLIEALNYCKNILRPDVIQMSLGTLYSDSKLLSLVREISKDGVLIISAFDNEKCLSYPAAYECVLGIDITKKYQKVHQYDFINNNVIDIRGADIFYRTKGVNDRKTIVHGSSFYCSYIVALVINNCKSLYKSNVAGYLKENAVECFDVQEDVPLQIEIKNAVVFPLNKENHSVAAFEHLLNFKVISYCDFRQRGKVGKRIKDLLNYSDNNKIVQNIDNLNWEDEFDTFICGHVAEISAMLKKDVLDEIAQKCEQYGKNLICYDNGYELKKRYPKMKILYPVMDKRNIPYAHFGKLRSPNIPIVGVFGTSSQQGKMTLQLRLREAFKNLNIKVKNIGSEPESPLFGFEFTYAFGYDSSDNLLPKEMITVLNEAVYNLEKEDCDIIIAGSQSGTVANQLRNLDMIPLKQYYFLLGVQPDSIILCINAYDSVEYIKRTIMFFESTVKARVICLCISFLNNKSFKPNMNSIEYYKEYFDIPICNLEDIKTDDIIKIIQRYYMD